MDFGLVGTITSRIINLPHKITCIDSGYIRPQLAACYLIEQGDMVGIIDTGTAYSVSIILDVLKYKKIPIENVLYVMPTHVHLGHAGGAGQLMQALPNAKLVIHPRGARHMIDPAKLWQGALAVYGEDAMYRMYGELLPVHESRVIIAEDNFELDLNGRKLLFIDTPGHARHHYSIYDEQSQDFFTGDTFGLAYRELTSDQGPYIMPTTTPIHFDPEAWFNTLDRYLSYQPQRMYLTHYGAVEDVEKLAGDLRDRIQQYMDIAHKYALADNRHTLIKNEIMETTLAQLQAMNCPVPGPACKGMLEMDFELNTQGLEVWLDNS